MTLPRRACLGLLAALLAAGPARAAATADAAEREERARIAAERARLGAAFDAEEAACRERFLVNACVDDVRARRRAALDPLRRRELDLDDAERRRRADARRTAVRERLAAPPPPEPPATAAPPPAPPASAPRTTVPAVRPDPGQEEAAAAARRAEAAKRRQQRAAETREEIRRREAERSARGKPSDPLPTPAALPPAPAASR